MANGEKVEKKFSPELAALSQDQNVKALFLLGLDLGIQRAQAGEFFRRRGCRSLRRSVITGELQAIKDLITGDASRYLASESLLFPRSHPEAQNAWGKVTLTPVDRCTWGRGRILRRFANEPIGEVQYYVREREAPRDLCVDPAEVMANRVYEFEGVRQYINRDDISGIVCRKTFGVALVIGQEGSCRCYGVTYLDKHWKFLDEIYEVGQYVDPVATAVSRILSPVPVPVAV